MRRVLFLLVAIGFALSAAGCNTVRGMGKDVERAGEGIQNATH